MTPGSCSTKSRTRTTPRKSMCTILPRLLHRFSMPRYHGREDTRKSKGMTPGSCSTRSRSSRSINRHRQRLGVYPAMDFLAGLALNLLPGPRVVLALLSRWFLVLCHEEIRQRLRHPDRDTLLTCRFSVVTSNVVDQTSLSRIALCRLRHPRASNLLPLHLSDHHRERFLRLRLPLPHPIVHKTQPLVLNHHAQLRVLRHRARRDHFQDRHRRSNLWPQGIPRSATPSTSAVPRS
ncbi:hypothetical protein BD410DRAFT_616881 [Rickenella mellea]|uniref:Uncharacterized protein n=1 Tax=Rickenella mellea TaxID=50990 RepID=A0A4Y7PMF6_9AGAM|nr:hypothetical protein BD410DRAFT_616881 [Rickenella mellea]